MSCAQSHPPSQPSAERRQMVKPPSLAHAPCELSHLCSRVSFGGCLLGWAGEGRGKSGGGFCLAAFTFKSPEPGVPTPFPGSEPERGKQRVFVQPDRLEAPHLHLRAPFLLSPKASPTAFPQSPKCSSWWAGREISLETSCQPPIALEEVISQEKQASGFHGAVNKQSIPEAEGREGSRRASFPPSPSLSWPINFSSRRWALRACQPRSPPPPPTSCPFSSPFLPSSL